ncbi:hypothetical protein THASP1DRAFT_29789 [Thamnocephalis sphaerospora]|uniref:Uncharacterized protein n=1 Tax=Thamnocephalis sphaerospora TaxID=78915 RepID=A0A4P9XSP8_9FUNG|nr:hypothetical protein THASP1DRAFT_29789 [Thamnocephalis sphaerospora]|eukprot:RKP08410.1 hypothetical protein THASP1DRAFT_29789 [Thamnocephalis sphaerospora]
MRFWDYISRRSVLPKDWMENSTYQWGIPLNPSGELNVIDFEMQTLDNVEETRVRLLGTHAQLVINVAVSYLFLRNFFVAVRMAYRCPGVTASWCCLLQGLVGVGYVVIIFLVHMPGGPSYRQLLWFVGITLPVSSICVSVALLQRAYLVHNRNKWLLVTGIIFLLPQPFITYTLWTSPVASAPGVGGIVYYPPYFPWVKLGMEAPINILFSGAFIMVVYRQYRRYGSAAWARLVRNGTQTICAIVITNFICMFCVAFEALGTHSEMFILLDWVVTSALLVRHCVAICTMHTTSDTPSNTNAVRNRSPHAAAANQVQPRQRNACYMMLR